MTLTLVQPVPQIGTLPNTLPREGAVNLELEEGVLVLRVSQATQDRIEELLDKQSVASLSEAEETELDEYEHIDDYLSFINRLTRNLAQSPPQELLRAS
jgi:hypothetical protein